MFAMIQLNIIPANSREALKAVAALAEEIWREHFTPMIGAAQVSYMLKRFQSLEAICSQTESEGYRYYLFQIDNKNVGYMAIQEQGNVLFLSKIYVLKSCRRQKIASRGIHFLEQLCREKGLEKIWLTVNKRNAGSIAAYKNFGFSIVRSQTADIGQGFVMDDYIMEKVVN